MDPEKAKGRGRGATAVSWVGRLPGAEVHRRPKEVVLNFVSSLSHSFFISPLN